MGGLPRRGRGGTREPVAITARMACLPGALGMLGVPKGPLLLCLLLSLPLVRLTCRAKCYALAFTACQGKRPHLVGQGEHRPPSWLYLRFPGHVEQKRRPQRQCQGRLEVAHTGFEPVVSALRGRRPRPLDECARTAAHAKRARQGHFTR